MAVIWWQPAVVCVLVAGVCTNAPAAERKLVWADEFEGSGLPDPARWDYEEGCGRQ